MVQIVFSAFHEVVLGKDLWIFSGGFPENISTSFVCQTAANEMVISCGEEMTVRRI